MTRDSSGSATTADGRAASSLTTLDAEAAAWAARARGLSRATLDRLGVVSGTVFFPDAERELSAVAFPYSWQGAPTGWKARAYPDKHFVSKSGGKYSFWNVDPVLAANPATVYITEGELDACALVEAGVPAEQVLSVPTGARDRKTDEEAKGKPGMAYVEAALKAGLSRASRFVWCGDADTAGRVLRDDMVATLGAARFWFVDWPDGTKDANEYLLTDGGVALRERVTDGALPWPVKGLYRLSDMPEEPQQAVWSTGFPDFDHKLKIGQRELSVVTGYPGHGKTLLWANIWFNIVREYDVPIMVGSFETRAKPYMRRHLRSFLIGKAERRMTDAEIATADRWIDDRYLFVRTKENSPPLAWFLEMAEVAVIRHGVRILYLDPWNRFEHTRAERESETEYVRRSLLEIYTFANDFNCHFQIVAHPRMGEGGKDAHRPPTLRDVAGSAHWDNIPDQGFTVHRRKFTDEHGNLVTEAELHHLKARFDETGHRCICKVRYDLEQRRFVSTDAPRDVGTNALPLSPGGEA